MAVLIHNPMVAMFIVYLTNSMHAPGYSCHFVCLYVSFKDSVIFTLEKST